ncbi:MAG: transposase [Dehalococcoidia bacterium]
MARRVARQLARLLERRGLGTYTDASQTDAFSEDEPLLAALYSASVRGRIAMGRRAGQRVLRLGDRIDADDLQKPAQERCVNVGGVSLHAGVGVPARDRRRLERLCRYAARPPVATERLSRLADRRLVYRLKHRWRDGSTHVVFEPLELLEKLAALVPPPRAHQVRYHGVLAPCASNRDRIAPGARPYRPAGAPHSEEASAAPVVPKDANSSPQPTRTPGAPQRRAPAPPMSATPADTVPSDPPTEPRVRRLSWAELMQRVFALDVLECPKCAGRMRILAAVHSPEAARAILECLGLPSRAPPNAPARPIDADPSLPGFSDESADLPGS